MFNWKEADIQRLQYCKQTAPHMSNQELAAYYNFHLDFVNQQLGENTVATIRKGKRPDWAKLATEYAIEHTGEETTAQMISESIGCSLPTAYKTIDNLPLHYWKIKRGLWQCHNPAIDKAVGL